MSTKARLLISFMVALFLFFLSLPRLPMYGSQIEVGYSILWISFCFLVIGANLHALLRLGRGEQVDRPAMSKEQREAIKRIQRSNARRLSQRRLPTR